MNFHQILVKVEYKLLGDYENQVDASEPRVGLVRRQNGKEVNYRGRC